MELNGQVGFPVALYEAYDDMVAYLKRGAKISIEELVRGIASPDVKGTYEGLVIPRKLPGPDDTVVDAKPAYEAAIKTARPALQQLYRDTFCEQPSRCHRISDRAEGSNISSNPDSSDLANFVMYHSRTPTPAAMPASRASGSDGAQRLDQVPVGLELDGARKESDRQLPRPSAWH